MPPPPVAPKLPTIPLTFHSLKRQANELWNYSDPMSPTYRERLHTYFTGSLAQAQTGAQAVEELARTEAAQLA